MILTDILRPALALLAVSQGDIPRASELSVQLGLPLASGETDPINCFDFDALLLVSGQRLALQQTARMAAGAGSGRSGKERRRTSIGALPGPVVVDFGSDAMRHRRRSGHNELLGKAVGVSGTRHPRVLDATAGLGRDSFVLADMGCLVTVCERDPVVALLLESGLQAALASEEAYLRGVARRMHLCPGDARQLVADELMSIDVIYLDPMFPQRSKSAAVKKEMALFQALLDDGTSQKDADDLLQWALTQGAARVVVKRPARAACLSRLQPSHSIAGKAVRFDVYVNRALPQ